MREIPHLRSYCFAFWLSSADNAFAPAIAAAFISRVNAQMDAINKDER